MKQLFGFGSHLRPRYQHLMSKDGYVKVRDMKVVSSDSPRCVQSLLSFMAGFLSAPPHDKTFPFPWQPFAFTTDNTGQMLAYNPQSCANFDQMLMHSINNGETLVSKMMAEDSGIIAEIADKMGKPMGFFEFVLLVDRLKSERLMGVDHPEWADELYTATMRKYESVYYDIFYANDYMTRIRLGLLLTDIVTNAHDIANNRTSAKKLQVYSVHDLNIYGLVKVLSIQAQVPASPHYADSIIFQLIQRKHENPFEVQVLFRTYL